jgi:iron(III) transport system ATP-binding protein
MELRRIHSELKVSTLLVTHSQEEALVMSDRIAVMRAGKIECIDTPARVYNRPPNRFVCTFLGEANILQCSVESLEGGEALLRCNGLRILTDAPSGMRAGQALTIAIRPEGVVLHGADAPKSAAGEDASVVDAVFKGSLISYLIAAGGQQLHVLTLPPRGGAPFAVGDRVRFSLPKSSIIPLVAEEPPHG